MRAHPPVEERFDVDGAETIADPLQRIGVVAGGEPVGQFFEADAGLDRLAFGPLVPVDPHLGRIGKVGAQLDEPGAEVVIPDVEVERRHPPLRLRERVARWSRLVGVVVIAGEHRLELLGHADGNHTRLGGRPQIRAHHVGLAVTLGEAHHRDLVLGGEGHHRSTKRGADPVEQRRRRDRRVHAVTQEHDDLAAHLQVRDIRVQIDAIEALQVNGDMTSQQIIDVRDLSHRTTPT
jgi:hypothetical protein